MERQILFNSEGVWVFPIWEKVRNCMKSGKGRWVFECYLSLTIFSGKEGKKKGRSRFSYHISTKFWFNNNVTIKTITIQLNLHIIHQIVHKYI